MAFIETPRFPEAISAQSSFGPNFSTSQARNLGGFRVSNQNWTYPLHEGDVSHIKTQAQLDDLLAFFHGCAGMHNGFRFKSWNDYTVTAAQGTTVQLTTETYQLYKTRAFGALSTAWKVSKPVTGTVTVNGGGSWSVDYTTGIITHIGSPVIAPTSWEGEFDFPVQFNIDKMLPQWISFEVYDVSSIPIVELRL